MAPQTPYPERGLQPSDSAQDSLSLQQVLYLESESSIAEGPLLEDLVDLLREYASTSSNCTAIDINQHAPRPAALFLLVTWIHPDRHALALRTGVLLRWRFTFHAMSPHSGSHDRSLIVVNGTSNFYLIIGAIEVESADDF